MTRRLTPTEKMLLKEIAKQKKVISTGDKINALYPNASDNDKAAIWNIVQKCRRLKIKHIVDQ